MIGPTDAPLPEDVLDLATDEFATAIARACRGVVVAPDCVWTEDDDGVWHTGCSEAFQFTAGGPAENRMRFCPYCGKPLKTAEPPNLGERVFEALDDARDSGPRWPRGEGDLEGWLDDLVQRSPDLEGLSMEALRPHLDAWVQSRLLDTEP